MKDERLASKETVDKFFNNQENKNITSPNSTWTSGEERSNCCPKERPEVETRSPDTIKEKLLEEIELLEKKQKGIKNNKLLWSYINETNMLRAKLQQHEETSKAKDEEFIKILDEILKEIINADECLELIFKIEEIKQKLEDLEEMK